jgi:hypothetical protein
MIFDLSLPQRQINERGSSSFRGRRLLRALKENPSSDWATWLKGKKNPPA